MQSYEKNTEAFCSEHVYFPISSQLCSVIITTPKGDASGTTSLVELPAWRPVGIQVEDAFINYKV